MKILIIDDEEFFIENLAQYLEKSVPAEIHYVTRAPKALQILKHEKFNLIVCDLNLPDQLEGELVLSINRINPNQRFIIISAKSEQEMHECLSDWSKLNIIGYFEKPFNMESIKDVIKGLLNMEHINPIEA